jgi:hypothetical protein
MKSIKNNENLLSKFYNKYEESFNMDSSDEEFVCDSEINNESSIVFFGYKFSHKLFRLNLYDALGSSDETISNSFSVDSDDSEKMISNEKNKKLGQEKS